MKKPRFHYMDWLRILAMAFVYLTHSSMPFGTVEDAWHIQFDQTNMAFTMIAGFTYQWAMHLFFFLAGAGSYFALASRTSRQYLVERVQRLFIPFFFGSLAFTALQRYISYTSRSGPQGSFLKFYPKVYERCFVEPLGLIRLDCFSLHLWFLGFLFLYSILTLPLFSWIRDQVGNNGISRLAAFSQKPGAILIFFLPTALVQAALRARYPGHTDWSDFFLWLIYFVYGYIFLTDKRFRDAAVRHRIIALAGGVVCMVTMSLLLLNLGYAEIWEFDPVFSIGYALYQVLRSLNTWLWVIFFLGMGIRHLDFRHSIVRYSREALLPFYIIHQVVIIPLAYLMIPWHPPLLVKFLVLFIGSFLSTIGLYEFFVRRFKVLRLLFGMRFTPTEKKNASKS